ncbi:MAG: isochorismatase family protein [Bdellovibrionota bacterium]
MVNPQGDENLIQKNNPNSFLDTELKEKLDALSVNAIVLCGAMSHMCIDATARAALDLGLECIVVEDACATLDLEFKDLKIPAVQVHGSFMTALEDAGCEITDLSTHL